MVDTIRRLNRERGEAILQALEANYKTVGRQMIPLSLEDKNVLIKEINIHYNKLIENKERR